MEHRCALCQRKAKTLLVGSAWLTPWHGLPGFIERILVENDNGIYRRDVLNPSWKIKHPILCETDFDANLPVLAPIRHCGKRTPFADVSAEVHAPHWMQEDAK